jgi:hypothetical protein
MDRGWAPLGEAGIRGQERGDVLLRHTPIIELVLIPVQERDPVRAARMYLAPPPHASDAVAIQPRGGFKPGRADTPLRLGTWNTFGGFDEAKRQLE